MRCPWPGVTPGDPNPQEAPPMRITRFLPPALVALIAGLAIVPAAHADGTTPT